MAIKDLRNRSSITSGVSGAAATGKGMVDQGHVEVVYRDTKGRSVRALVMGPGSASGLKLKIFNRLLPVVVDNVPAATGVKQTNVYFNHASW